MESWLFKFKNNVSNLLSLNSPLIPNFELKRYGMVEDKLSF